MTSFGKGHFAVVERYGGDKSALCSGWWQSQEHAEKKAAELQRKDPTGDYAVVELVFRWFAKTEQYKV